MGVTDLWSILGPVRKHVPLESLAGKTLAVDLSIWVCEAQMVKQMIGVVHKPHLRNLFFRISSLSLLGVKLVFVSEGEAPKLKAETMSKRNEMRYGPSATAAPPKAGRSYFKSVLKECLLMLECLGIPWVQAAGEAEAMCAYLNAHGYVDGCITNDGDVFLYGAQTVYRNFTMNVKDPHVDCYEVSKIKAHLGLDREELVGLAILLGCDYLPKGVPGVRKVQALKLIEMLKGESLLQRFYLWEKDCNVRGTTKAPKKKTHCSVCCHPGSAKDHERNGCKMCESDRFCEPHDYDYRCPCDWHKDQREKVENSAEFNIRRKAQRLEGFPFHPVIDEFLINKNKLVKVLKWRRPGLLCFQNFAAERMDWPRHYSCEKLLVLLTYYDMNERKAGREHKSQLQAIRIVKTRIRNGSPCFEIEWVKPDGYVFADDHPAESPLLTIEEESLFRAAYPLVVALFHKEKQEAEENKLKCKKSKPKSKAVDELDDVASLLSELSLKPVTEKQTSLELKEDGGDSGNVHEKPARNCNFLGFFSDVDSAAVKGTVLDTKPDCEVYPSPTTDSDPSHALCSSPAPSNPQHLTAASPNISALISDLQLSSIDWDSTSFSQSPQAHTKDSREVEDPVEFSYKPTTSNLGTSEKKSDEVGNKIARPGTLIEQNKAQLTSKQYEVEDFHKLPLKERVLLKNAVQCGVPYPATKQSKPVPSVHVKPVPLVHVKPVHLKHVPPVHVKPVHVKPAQSVETKPVLSVDLKPVPSVDVKPVPSVDVKPVPSVDVKPVPSVDVKPVPSVEVKPVLSVDAKHVPSVHVKPVPRVHVKPVPSVHVKPVPLSLHNQGLTDNNSITTSLDLHFKEQVHPKLLIKVSRDPSQQENRPPPVPALKPMVCSSAKPQIQGGTGTKTYNFVKNVKAVSLVPVNVGKKVGPLAAYKSLGKKSVCQKGTLFDQEDQPEMQATCPSTYVHPLSKGVKGDKLHRPPYGGNEVKQNKENSPSSNNLICVFLSPDSKVVTKRASDCSTEESDGDDSIISVDSPLPLAERLKLRLLQQC